MAQGFLDHALYIALTAATVDSLVSFDDQLLPLTGEGTANSITTSAAVTEGIH